MIQFGDPEENTNLDNDNQHAFGLPKDKMGGAYNVAEFFNECRNVIANTPINIDEKKMLSLLQITYRWQKNWIHVINNCGKVGQPDNSDNAGLISSCPRIFTS